MKLKKDFPALLLSAILSMGYVSASEKPQQKIRFSLAHQPRYSHHLRHGLEDEFSLFGRIQKRMQQKGEDYIVIRVPGDNMPLFVPNMNKYNMPIVKPGPEWYRNDKFVIKPGLEWGWPQDLRFKEFYKNRRPSRGILLYEWQHK